ncbi:MAG: RagB/SusD family nutrient uptake outer membrane protein [Niabella sp.]
MNKINIILLMVFASALASCGKNFLTEENPNLVTTGTYWKTAQDAERGLNAVYGALQLGGVSGEGAVFSGFVTSDEAMPNVMNGNFVETMDALNYTADPRYIEAVWADMYTGVFRANQVIEKLPGISMNENLKTRYIAEARFLRGWFYFWLSNHFNKGAVILHDKIPVSVEDYYKDVSSKETIDAFIIDDLEFAQAHLPKVQEEKGRVTWGAATATLGKYYLYNKKWDRAASYFKQIIDESEQNNLYALVNEYKWNFDEAHEFNSESIFEVSFSTKFKPGMNGGVNDGNDGSEATSVERNLAPPAPQNGWRIIVPSYTTMLTMMNDKMDPADPKNIGRRYPLRATASIAINNDDYGTFWGVKLPMAATGQKFVRFNQQSAGYIRKYTNWETREIVDVTNNRSGLNVRKIRLADVFLMYAEAVLQNSGDMTAAIKYINKVRERAAVLPVTAAEYPTPQSILNFLMYIERPCELSFEGQAIRWHDLRRWGILGARLKEVSEIPVFWNPANNVTPPRYTVPGDKNPDGSWRQPGNIKFCKQAASGNYSTEKDYWPLPPSELLNNGSFLD